jgi:hypothetical protein
MNYVRKRRRERVMSREKNETREKGHARPYRSNETKAVSVDGGEGASSKVPLLVRVVRDQRIGMLKEGLEEKGKIGSISLH